MRFAHISDTHIRNLKDHDLYKKIFEELYSKLKESKIDKIVHTGDIIHSKTSISPELIIMVKDFIRNLSEIAPTYILLGNHDGLVSNKNRVDSISAIIQDLSGVKLLKHTKKYPIDDVFNFYPLSIFDNKPLDKPDDGINISLYHGTINNGFNNFGFIFKNKDVSVNTFKDFDYVMLGDLHRCQSFRNKTMWYAGSTIQQNFGEGCEKGFLIWDIKSKTEHNVEFVKLNNPSPYLTIKKLEDITPKLKNARVRYILEDKVSFVDLKHIEEKIWRQQPATINFVESFKKSMVDEASIIQRNNNVLQDFFKQSSDKEDLLILDKHYSKKIDDLDETNGKVWSIEHLEWNNVLNFGKGNEIDFNNFYGITGIFGANYSGKSNLLDTIIYAIFGKITKNIKRNEIINEDEKGMNTIITLSESGDIYKIIRTLKKQKGTSTKSAIRFYKNGIDITSVNVKKTQQHIESIFGTYEDFILTCYSTQNDFSNFVSQKNTKRKEILSKFLNLSIFDKKLSLAKKDLSQDRSYLKRLQAKRTNELSFQELRSQLATLEQEIAYNEKSLQDYEKQYKLLANDFARNNNILSSIQIQKNIESFNIQDCNVLYKVSENARRKFYNEKEKHDKLYAEYNLYSHYADFDHNAYSDLKKQHQKIEIELARLKEREKSFEVSTPLCLKKYPEFHECPFVVNFLNKEEEKKKISQQINKLKANLKNTEQKIKTKQQEFEQFEKYMHINRDLNIQQNRVQQAQKQYKDARNEEERNLQMINIVEKQKTNISKAKKVRSIISSLDIQIGKLGNEKHALQTNQNKNLVRQGQIKEKINSLIKLEDELVRFEKRVNLLEAYCRAMHPSGIPQIVIQDNITRINDEINKILHNNSDFSVKLTLDNSELEVKITHNNQQERSIEAGSGAENMVTSMAIRLALISITNLPRSDIFILDEPYTSLEEKNLKRFGDMLNMIKTQFKTIYMVTHLDTLKNIADDVILIKKKHNKAYLEI